MIAKTSLLRKMLILLCAIFFTTYAQGQSLDTAGSYLGYIGEQADKISHDQWDYIKATAHGKSARKVEKRRTELVNSINNAKRTIQKMPKFKGDGSLRDSIAYFLHVRYLVFKEDYAKIINLEDIAERSYNDMEAYLLAKEAVAEKLASASENISAKYEAFAGENNIQLVSNDSKLSKRLRISGEVYEYYNDVYLMFFKSYKAEESLLEAVGNNDLNAIEQSKNALLTYANDDLSKLKTHSAYKGDKSLLEACQTALEFYKDEAENKMQVVVDYHLKREKFEQVKKTVEGKKPNKRSQADVYLYNKSAKEMNKSVNDYNNLMKQLNDQRTKVVEGWNKKRKSFMNKHVP